MKICLMLVMLLLMYSCSPQKQKSYSFEIKGIEITVVETIDKDVENIMGDPCSGPVPIAGAVNLKKIIKKTQKEIICDPQEPIVLIQYIIDTLGNTKNHEIIRGACEAANDEAIRLTKLFKFKPQVCNGKLFETRATYKFEFSN